MALTKCGEINIYGERNYVMLPEDDSSGGTE
jgi:hypothetical protein